jgi:hypothetical protein
MFVIGGDPLAHSLPPAIKEAFVAAGNLAVAADLVDFGLRFGQPRHAPIVAERIIEVHTEILAAEALVRKVEVSVNRGRNAPFHFLGGFFPNGHIAAIALARKVLHTVGDSLEPGVCVLFPDSEEGIQNMLEHHGVLDAAGQVGPSWQQFCDRYRTKRPRYDLDELGAVMRLEVSPFAEPPPAPRIARTHLAIDGNTVTVHGQPVDLDLTAERTEDALAFLRELLKEPGTWKTGPDIGKATSRERLRFDRIFQALPAPIKALMESHIRKGYRLRPLA